MKGYFSFGPLSLLAHPEGISFLKYAKDMLNKHTAFRQVELVKILAAKRLVDFYQGYEVMVKICGPGYLKTLKYLINNNLWRPSSLPIHQDSIQDAITSASCHGRISLIKYLKEQGADISEEESGSTINASSCGQLSLLKYLVKEGALLKGINQDALLAAAWEGHIGVVRYLILQGYDIGYENYQAFSCAVEKGSMPVVKYLVSQGGDFICSKIHKKAMKYIGLNSLEKVTLSLKFNRTLHIKDLLKAV